MKETTMVPALSNKRRLKNKVIDRIDTSVDEVNGETLIVLRSKEETIIYFRITFKQLLLLLTSGIAPIVIAVLPYLL